MSSDTDDATPGSQVAAEVEDARIEREMEQSYIDYAMSVIAGRALPDARDGLKPVHRRILYAMQEAGVTAGASHRKSSSIVGETMGDYHPHGDSAIYDALARMAQDFSMRHPLVDGQGNFGSVDGDPPAAMRYTEARMSPIAEELLADIERDTVDFTDNYDGRLQEPEVLPAGYPNLLVNGSSGIAVGMSTNVPPHNLAEIVDAAVALVDDPDLDAIDLVDTDHLLDGEAGSTGPVKGPDFPTGATVVGAEGVLDAYKTGRGRVRVRADYEVTDDRIVVTELPYQTNKSRLVERIADDVNEGKIDGVRDLRDESDRDGIRVVIELKRDAQPDVVENQLLDSHLESTFGVITLALVDGEPRILDLKEALEVYLDHRREVVRRRSKHELAEREERAHVLEGRLKALSHAEDVVETIRDAEDRDAAKLALQAAYDFSERQAKHVVAMQLGSLTSLEAEAIETEYENVRARIEELETILADEDELMAVVREELLEVKAEYADPRRTSFTPRTGQVTREDLIEQRDDVVVVSEDDYIKRMPLSEFSAQRRGGKGIIGADLKEGDRVSSAFVANTHDYLLCFTNHGQVYQLKAYQIPEMSRTARGKSAVNVLDLDDEEEIAAVVDTDDMDAGFLTMATAGGRVKRTSVDEFGNILSTGIRAIRLEEGDELVDVAVTGGEGDLVLATANGMSIRFAEDDVRAMGRTARGVRGIQLEGDDRVVGIAPADGDVHDWLLTVTKNGYGKRTDIGSYRRQSRNGKGLIDIKTDGRNGPVCSTETVSQGDHLLVTSEGGQIIRTPVEDISTVGRNTMGVTVMDVAAADRVASVDVIDAERVEDGPGGDESESEEATAEA
ncbi:MAG: DNA gyrase subunit A [Haloferacaceae archaeon]